MRLQPTVVEAAAPGGGPLPSLASVDLLRDHLNRAAGPGEGDALLEQKLAAATQVVEGPAGFCRRWLQPFKATLQWGCPGPGTSDVLALAGLGADQRADVLLAYRTDSTAPWSAPSSANPRLEAGRWGLRNTGADWPWDADVQVTMTVTDYATPASVVEAVLKIAANLVVERGAPEVAAIRDGLQYSEARRLLQPFRAPGLVP